VELMFVITLLGIIATMAIPTFFNSRKTATEASAVASMRSFSSAEIVYRTRFAGYATIADLWTKGLVDQNFSDGEKSGYTFISVGAPTTVSWAIAAVPTNPGLTGDRSFFIDETGVIRYCEGGTASAGDAPIQ
jgi:type II secretory pathway pseudopilin PulG